MRVAVANGSEFDMGDVDPRVYLDNFLVAHHPNLRGATWTQSTRTNANGGVETLFHFAASAATKG
jgi:hypothetical protein